MISITREFFIYFSKIIGVCLLAVFFITPIVYSQDSTHVEREEIDGPGEGSALGVLTLNALGQIYQEADDTPIVDLEFPFPLAQAFDITTSENGAVILDRFGLLYTTGDADSSFQGEMVGVNILRDVELSPSGNGAYVLSGFGAVITYGDAVNYGAPYFGTLWNPMDAAEDLELTPTGLGYYILDCLGGVHPYGDAVFYGDLFLGFDIVRDMEVAPAGDGYLILDGFGLVHGFGSLEGIAYDLTPNGPAAGANRNQMHYAWDHARDMELHLNAANNVDGWYILDGFGNVLNIGAAAPIVPGGVAEFDIFVDLEMGVGGSTGPTPVPSVEPTPVPTATPLYVIPTEIPTLPPTLIPTATPYPSIEPTYEVPTYEIPTYTIPTFPAPPDTPTPLSEPEDLPEEGPSPLPTEAPTVTPIPPGDLE